MVVKDRRPTTVGFIVAVSVLLGAGLGITSALAMGAPFSFLFGSILGGVCGLVCSVFPVWMRSDFDIYHVMGFCFILAWPVALISGLTHRPDVAVLLTFLSVASAFLLSVRSARTTTIGPWHAKLPYVGPLICILVATVGAYQRRIPDDIPSLVRMMGSNDMETSAAAANKLRKYGKSPFLQALHDPDQNVRSVAAHMLGLLRDPSVQGALIAASTDSYEYTRMWVAFSLGNVGDRAALTCLERLTKDPYEIVRRHAREAIGEINARGGSSPQTQPVTVDMFQRMMDVHRQLKGGNNSR